MFKKNILTGLLVLIPYCFNFMGTSYAHPIFRSSIIILPKEVQPDVFFGGAIPGYGVIVTLIVVFLTGCNC
jgi:uncharacterized membrane protein